MSVSYGATPPGITGTHYGGSGIGCRGDAIASAGLNGAGYLYSGLSLPGEAAVEVRGPITRWPSGTLTVYEDSSFVYVGSTDYALYALYSDGVASTADIGYGAGIGRIDLDIGYTSQMSGGCALDAVTPSGTLTGVVASLSGDVALDVVAPSGSFDPSYGAFSGGVTLDAVDPSGALIGADEPMVATASHGRRKLQTATRSDQVSTDRRSNTSTRLR